MIRLGALKLDPAALASQGNAILGIRDSGKTYTATVLAERLFDAGVPFVAFDPIGVWRFLRVPRNDRAAADRRSTSPPNGTKRPPVTDAPLIA